MGAAAAGREHLPMIETTGSANGRSLRDPAAVAREARRLVGLERQYHCRSCGVEHSSWTRMSACPDCGEAYVAAVIRRAALAGG